jgi:hypothetical protein
VTDCQIISLCLQTWLCLEPSVSKSGILSGYTLIIQHRVDAKDCGVAGIFSADLESKTTLESGLDS